MDMALRIQQVIDCLREKGWGSSDLHGYCVGSKSFEILDGIEKTALIWGAPWPLDDVLQIRAEYWSEGNNILSGMTLSLTSELSFPQIDKGLGEFLREAEFHISESYGVRMKG